MIRLKTKIFIRILSLLIAFTIALSILITGFLLLDKRNRYTRLYETTLAHVGNRIDQLLLTDNNEDKIRGVLRSLLSRGTVVIYSFLEKEGVKFIQAQRKGYNLNIPEICLSLEAKSSVIKFDLEFGVTYNVSTPITKEGYRLHVGILRSLIDEEIKAVIPYVILINGLIIFIGIFVSCWISNRITKELVMVNKELVESENRFRTAFITSPDSVTISSLDDGKYLLVNESFTALMGYSREEAEGKTAEELGNWIRGEDREDFVNALREKGNIQNKEVVLRTRNGAEITALLSAKIINLDNKPHLLVIGRDIRDIKKIEAELIAEKEQLAITLRSMGDGVVTTDNRGRLVLLNRQAEILTGYKQKDVKGKNIKNVFDIRNENKESEKIDLFNLVINTGSATLREESMILISADGKKKIISATGSPIRDRESTIIGAVFIFRDITERRKLEKEVIRAQKIESLGTIAGGIAHDFNNFLTASISNISLAREISRKDSKVTDKLYRAEKALQRASNLTHQLMTFTRDGLPVKETSDISHLIKETVTFILTGSNIKPEIEIQKDIWPAEIDKAQITQVINNLVLNAMHSMKASGSLKINVQNFVQTSEDKKPLRQGEYIKISIVDSGKGIPEKDLSNIFDPYFTTKKDGSGLGLASVYSIVKKHDGYVDVKSKINHGTTFYVYLPAEKGGDVPASIEKRELVYATGKILIMDDEEIIRDATSAALAHLGYKVTAVGDGKDAIEEINKSRKRGNSFDLVILDLTIPGGMSGLAAIKEIKRIAPTLKAIVTTGYSQDSVMANYKDYGFHGFLMKPFSIDEISKIVDEIINS